MSVPLNIGTTGARSGDYLRATADAKQNKGSVIQIRGAMYPPFAGNVEQLKFTDYRDRLPDKAEFFSNKTPDEIKKYLESTAITKSSVYLNHIEGMEIRFIEMAGEQFTPEIMDVLGPGDFMPATLVADLFTIEGTKSNMVFRGTNWEVMDTRPVMEEVDGVVVGTDGSSSELKGIIDTRNSLLFDDILVETSRGKPYTKQDIEQYINKDVRELLKWATPSIHKSLIQKMIRTRCLVCTHEGKEYPGLDVLITSFCMLVEHPGVFNEVFKEFETGLQSATKRLGVTVAEDSNVFHRDLMALFAAGAYAKKFKSWKPDAVTLDHWVNILKYTHNALGVYKYQFDPVDIPVNPNPLNLCYHLLEYTGALSQDIPMVGWIAKNKGALSEVHTNNEHINVPLVHCLDQHNLTAIAWHFPYKVVDKIGSYSELFKLVWRQSSSLNGRKDAKTTDQVFLGHLRTAQLEVWRLMSGYRKKERTPTGKTVTLVCELHDSWISAIVGIISHKLGSRKIKSMINGNDLEGIMSMVAPSRGMKETDDAMILSEDEKASLAKTTWEILRVGVTGTTPEYLGHLGKLKVTYRNEQYYVNGVPWSEFKMVKVNVPLCTPLPHTRENGCLYGGDYIEADYKESIKKLYTAMSPLGALRLAMYVQSVESKISMHKIGRNGESVYYMVEIQDTEVYNFLASLCVVAPVAIEPVRDTFVVKNGVVFSLLTQIIKDMRPVGAQKASWPGAVSDGRNLYQHQADAVDRLVSSKDTKNIINITAGLGKTLIVIRYFLHLIQSGKMPEYVIYALPPSALNGVVGQFEASGFKSNVLNMTQVKKVRNTKILPGVINYVYHDHMRMGDFKDEVGKLSTRMFLVVDEMHKCLSDTTTRTSIALVLANVSSMFIGMTGTLIMNEKHGQLIEWLKLVTKFEVNRNNYYIALGMLISSRIQTKVTVVRDLVHVDLTPEERIVHDKSFENAKGVCYDVVTKELISLAVKYANNGGCFVVAKDVRHQKYIVDQLKDRKITRVFSITSTNSIDYQPGDSRRLQVIVTTPQHSTGYTITGMSTMLTSVYFSNQATRDQLDARLNRIGQPSETVRIVTVHCGILTYVLERYNYIKSVSDAIKSFSDAVSLGY